MSSLETILDVQAWSQALAKYGAATHLAAAVYGPSRNLIVGPVHSTPLFEAAAPGGHSMFENCARRCMREADAPVVVEGPGIAVIGSALVVDGKPAGAVVAGYAVTAFPNETTLRHFALEQAVPLSPVWRAVRQQAPLTKARLKVYAELLNALAESLLHENLRTQQFQRAARFLEEENRAKDEFLAMLAHELRNPLAAIQMAMHIATAGAAAASTVQEARDAVARQLKHLARLLDDLLDVSRSSRGTIELQKEPVEITSAVASALETTRATIATHEHSLAVSLPEEPLFVEADPVRLEQIIVNLVNNAAKYTPPKGRIAVSVAREDGQVVLRVRDNGMGIAPELLPHVFDLFKQGDRSIAHAGGGLGVGLTIVQNLVALHGGSVTAHSDDPGSGSEFVVRLPIARVAVASPKPECLQPQARPSRVLIIEDNRDSREMLRGFLELEGHHVDVAGDGPTGVELVLSRCPDIAIVDIGLPGFDGLEVARRVRKALGSAVRLIALSGYGHAEHRERARESGFDEYLVKPVSPENLAKTIAAMLDVAQ